MLKEINEFEVFQNENWGWGVCNIGALDHSDVSVVGAHVMKKAAFMTLTSLIFGGCITDMGEVRRWTRH